VAFAMPYRGQSKEHLEDEMKNLASKSLLLVVVFALLGAVRFAYAQQPPSERPPADVVGKWIIYAKDPNGTTSTKYIDLTQKGTELGGHFKGPHQSGGLEGTINNQHIVFHTKTRAVLVFRGFIDGDTIQGTFHAREGTGEWQAVRSN
jgi:hypothetical protein